MLYNLLGAQEMTTGFCIFLTISEASVLDAHVKVILHSCTTFCIQKLSCCWQSTGLTILFSEQQLQGHWAANIEGQAATALAAAFTLI